MKKVLLLAGVLSMNAQALCVDSEKQRVEWAGMMVVESVSQSAQVPLMLPLDGESFTPIITPLPPGPVPVVCNMKCRNRYVTEGACKAIGTTVKRSFLDSERLEVYDDQRDSYPPSLTGQIETDQGPLVIHYLAGDTNINWGSGILMFSEGSSRPQTVPLRFRDDGPISPW